MPFYSNFIHTITSWQYKLNAIVSSNLRSFETDDSLMGIFIILGISFIYGVIHAAGPGHGKALVGFYFLKEGGSYKKVFKIGYLIAIIHATSALLFTFGVYFLLNTLFSRTFHQISKVSITISAILIIIVGFYLIYEAYKHKNERDKKIEKSNKSDLAIALSAGVVPCPGVMTITLFSISLGHTILGIASAMVMSIGMGLTISLAGIFSVALQKKNANAFGKYGYILESLAALLIIGLGSFLLIGSLNR